MKRILIVDDAIDLGRLLQDALKTVHPEIPITVVPSAEEALLEASRFTIDVLITDVRLPGMSGFDLIRKFRVRQPNVKVVVMTGLPPEDRLLKQNEIPSDVFLRKPILTPTFLDAVDQLLGEGKTAEKAPEKAPEKPVEAARAVDTVPVASAGSISAAGSPVTAQRGHDPVGSDAAKEALLRDLATAELASVLPGERVEPKAKVVPSRRATGALGVPPAAEPAPGESGLSGIVSGLRGSLSAIAVMLLDERGHPVAQAGDLPDLSLEGQLIQPIMSSLSAGAKISYVLGQTYTQAVHAYRGVSVDLVIAPVGQYALLMALRAGKSALRLALAFEEALNAQAELAGALETMGLHIQSGMEVGVPEAMLAELGLAQEQTEETIPPEILETPLGQDPSLEKFEELFTRKKTGKLRLEDPDAFWDSATDQSQEVSQSGVLSFEQAQKLGLLPPEEKE